MMWATILATLSAIMLFGFIALGVVKFGLLPSYSAYSEKWGEAVPMMNSNLWSLVTFLAAALLTPVMIQLGALSALQFLGFLTPVYLMAVSLTPGWYKDKEVNRFHTAFALLCAISGGLWSTLVMSAGAVFAAALAVVGIIAIVTKTLKTSSIFWSEMVMFLTVYITVLLLVF